MKKILLSLAIALTACNLTIGISYATVCQSREGRACGTSCVAEADGTCWCHGACTAREQEWVEEGDDEIVVL